MIGMLGHRSTEDYLRHGLIARGESAVGPLISATRRAIRRYNGTERSGWDRYGILSSTVHCLGEIGGSEAEAFLADIVRAEGRFADLAKVRVYPNACVAYAKCAGSRAVPELIAAYRRTTDDANCAVILAALVRTADKHAISYVLSHMDVLLRCDGYDYDHEREVRSARRAIVYGTGIADLKNPQSCRSQGAWGPMETAWQEKKAEIWERWERLLDG